MAWRVGMKVICVDASGIKDGRYVRGSDGFYLETTSQIEAGQVYTIAWIGEDPVSRRVIFHLLERRRPNGLGYRSSRFRPVVEREYDISISTRMLQPAKKAAETVGFLAFMAAVCVGVQFYQFLEGQ